MRDSSIAGLVAQYMAQIRAIERLIAEVEQRRGEGSERQLADLHSMKSDLWFSVGLMNKYLRKKQDEPI